MDAIVFALIAYTLWGSGDVVAAVASRRLGSYTMMFWTAIISLFFFAFYAPFVLSDLTHITPFIFLTNLFVCFFFLTGYLTFTQALIEGPVALVGTIAGSFGSIAVILSIIFFHEHISYPQVLGIIAIFFGVVLSTFHYQEVRKKNFKFTKGILLALITMVLWGFFATFVRIPVEKIGWFWPNVINFLFFPPVIYLFTKLRHEKIGRLQINKGFTPLFVSTIMGRLAEFSYNVGISKGLTAIVAPVASSYPTLFALLSYFVFKEKLTKQQIAGMILALCGIVVLATVQ